MKILLTALLFLCSAIIAIGTIADPGSGDAKDETVKPMMKTVENTLWCGVRRESSGEDMLVAYEFLPDGKAFMIWVWLPRSAAVEANGAIMLGSYAVDVKYELSSSGVKITKNDGELVFHYRDGSLVNEEDGRPPFALTRVGVSHSVESNRSPSGRHLPSILEHLTRPAESGGNQSLENE